MIYRYSLAMLALAMVALPAGVNASSVEKVRNQQVIVTEETLEAGEVTSLTGDRPMMFVYLTDGTAARAHVSRGDIVFYPADKKMIKNDGASRLKFARIEFLNKANPERWGMTGLAPNYKTLLENEYARAYEIKIPAQSLEPQHTHHDRVVVCLVGAELEHILPSGERQPSTLKTGEIGWRPGATHTGHNMGHTDLWVIAIEPK